MFARLPLRLTLALPLLLSGCGNLPGSHEPAFWAAGQEPFWQITVQHELLVLRTPDRPNGQAMAVRPQALANGMRWTGRDGDRRLRFEVRAGICRDVMSGAVFTHVAVWQLGDREASGCAVMGTRAPSWRDGEAP